MTAPATKPVQSVETAQEDNQELLERQFQETLSLEVPESAQLQLTAQLLGVILLGNAKYREEILSAFSVINNKNYYNYLLKLRDPQTFAWVEQNFRVVKREIDLQNNQPKNKGKQLDEYKVRVGPFSQKISREEYVLKSQAYSVASAVHHRINADDIRNKFGQTAAVFGLTPQSTLELKRSMAGWMKENPGRSYDDYMLYKGRQFYLQQQLKPGQKLDKDTLKQLEREHRKILKEKSASWRSQSDAFRVSTIKSQREMVIRAQEVIKRIQKGVFTDEQIKQQLDYVLHGKKETPAPTTVPSTTATATQIPHAAVSETIPTPIPVGPTATVTTPPLEFQPTVSSSSFQPSLETPHVTAQTAGVPVVPHAAVPPGRFAGVKNFFSSLRSSGFGKLLGGLGKGLGVLGGGFGGLLTQGLTSLAGKIATKLGVRAGLGAATGGIYTAVSGLFSILGINLDKIVLKAALFAVMIPVVFIVLVIFLFSAGSLTQFPIGGENATEVNVVSLNQESQLGWQEFEKKYLLTGPERNSLQNTSWSDFEKGNLLFTVPFLSLQNSSR